VKLRPREKLVYKARPHWIVFAWAIWLASLAVRFHYAGNYVSNAADAGIWLGLAWAFGVFTLVAAILAQSYRLSDRQPLLPKIG
jgi:hypothetical protein